ncbi:MAG: nitroreductase family protein [Planctomycetes bacterium]|nr:nitroreductase family protein [Planctomycetota bacterium]
MPVSEIDSVERVIHARRTHKSYTGAPIDRATVERVLDAGRWAPNHRLSEPWRFYALDQAAIVRLIAFLRGTPQIVAGADPARASAKLEKLLARLPQAGALIAVTWVRGKDPTVDLEDHAATAAAVQNALLVATGLGLGSYWSTSAGLVHPLTLRWYGVDSAREAPIGCIWLGHAAEAPVAPPRRPLSERLRWLEAA